MYSFLITGSTGFLGDLLVDQIIKQHQNEEICLILLVRDTFRAKSKYQKYHTQSNIHFIFLEYDITDQKLDEICLPCGINDIIHCAAVTDSSYMVSHPVETADGIVIGTKKMLDLARKYQVQSMVYLSSMEVYGTVEEIGRPRHEAELGTVVLESPRSCYPLAKRMAEHYCHIYYQQYGVPVKIARLAQTFGKGVPETDRRVFMQFAKAVVEGKDIVLQTAGNSIGNYCASEDAVKAVLLLLERGKDGETYNVVNETNTMSIRQMADLVAEEIAEGRIRVKSEGADAAQYAPDTALRMSAEKLKGLGWMPTKGLKEMYWDLIKEISFSESI